MFVKLTRRYKYLEKMFEEEMGKVLLFVKGFTPSERIKLARMTALWLGKHLNLYYIYYFNYISFPKSTAFCRVL